MKYFMLVFLFVANVVLSQTVIVYDETISRFIDKDISYITGSDKISTVYYADRIWNVTELNLAKQKLSDELLLKKYTSVVRVSEKEDGVKYFKNFNLKSIIAYFDTIGYNIPYILLLVDSKHSLSVTQQIKSEAVKYGIHIDTKIINSKYSIEKAVLESRSQQRGIILNLALVALERETNTVLTYNEISHIITSRNTKHVVVGLNRSNSVCLCATKESISGLLHGGDLIFDIMLNASVLSNNNKTKLLLDGIHTAKEINFEY